MCVCVCFFQREIFEVSLVKPVKFIRDSSCLARDEFLVIKADHILIYMYIFAIVLLLGAVLHSTT